MIETSEDNTYGVGLLQHMAANAAARVTRSANYLRDDIEAELMLWGWEHQERIKDYLNNEKPLRERRNKLFVTLVRQGNKFLHKHIEVESTEINLDEMWDEADIVKQDYESIPSIVGFNSPWRKMSKEEVIELLPFIHLEDGDVPRDYRLQVGVIRQAVLSSTRQQQVVITRLAMGMSYQEIAEDLAITPSAANKRFTRSKLVERCELPQRNNKRP